ncbi:UNVERIFIED_CONTAM: hypothetical protein FKN15_067124 [Acipenser sinensis]
MMSDPVRQRTSFLDSSTLQLFFDLYHSIPPSLSPLVLSCLVQIASVRRSLFNNAERAKFLSHLVDGVKRILENPQSLSDPNNYHEFCRLLARLKSNYQLGELVKVENYPEVIRLIANFTVTSLQHWEFAPNSVHYLLSLWQRLAASVPYVKATEPHLLETYTPEVTKAYITSRLESVHIILRDGLEDPLDDTGLVQQQLDQLSTIGRCEYEKTCALLVQLFDQSAQSYQELLQSSNASAMDIAVQEGRLTWLVYIIGAVIGGRVSFASTDEQDAMDGELVCRVLQLMNLTDSRLAQAGNEKLELAMLSFFEQFRKIYIGDQVQKSSKLYRRLSEVLGLNDETMVLSVFIGKISVRKLVKLSAVQFMLNNHTSEHFSFLGINNQSNLSDMRCRTTFYTALGRLLMVDLGEDEDQFEQFMLPLTAAFETVAQMFSTNTFNEQEAKSTLVGLVRDLRGIAFAFNAKTSFMMLFDWIYPAYMPILQRAIELWYHDPACTTPVLKLMAELVHNRSQRLQFDVSSPNGILLFRETSKIITMYDTMVCTGCCSSLDHIVTYLFKQLSRSTKKRSTPMAQESDRFLHIMQQHPEMIQQMLSTVLNIIIFEDCRNQWSMSRPLLGLILLNEKYFADLRNSIVNSQPPEKQQAMHLCFENLMEGIERNLLTKNRDRSFKLDCPARVLAYADRHKDCFVISKSCLTHNHDVSADAYNQYPESRRLSQTEKEKAEELLRLNLSPAKVKDYLNSLTGKCITAKDIYNLKLKLSSIDTKKDSSPSISDQDVVRRVIKDEDFACDAYEDKPVCTVPEENHWMPALPGVNVDANNFVKCQQQIDKPTFKTQASQTEIPCKCRDAGCELNEKNKTATFVSDDTKYQHQLALRTICLGAEAKDEFNVVEIVPDEGEGADAKPVPLATLKSSVMPTVTISGIELPPQVTFRLKAGSGPVYISGQHILEEDLSFDEEDGEEEDEVEEEEIEESPPKPVKREASNKKSAPAKRKKTDEKEEEDEEEEDLKSVQFVSINSGLKSNPIRLGLVTDPDKTAAWQNSISTYRSAGGGGMPDF